MSRALLRPARTLRLQQLVTCFDHARPHRRRRIAHPQIRHHGHVSFFSTVQPITAASNLPSLPPLASPSPPQVSPTASLLASFAAHQPPSPLPSSLRSSATLLSAELRLLHRSLPFFVGFSSQLLLPGSHFTVECGGVSVVLVRGEDNTIRALFNNCTHQNARICPSSRPDLALHSHSQLPSSGTTATATPPLQLAPTCHYATKLVCPMHHWTFGLDGQHLAPRTPLTRDPEQRKAFAMRRATVEEVDGVLWATMRVASQEADSAARSAAAAAEVRQSRDALRQQLLGLSSAERGSTLIGHNWKAVFAALAERSDTVAVFPSAAYTSQPSPLLLQLLPLTEQLTAVTAYGLGVEAELAAAADRAEASQEEWKQWLDDVTRSSQAALDGTYAALYHRLMLSGLRAEVDIEEQKSRDVAARRDRLLNAQ